MPAAKDNPGEWGTAECALLLSPFGFNRLHPFLVERMEHVHLYRGGLDTVECVKNRFGPRCSDGKRVPK